MPGASAAPCPMSVIHVPSSCAIFLCPHFPCFPGWSASAGPLWGQKHHPCQGTAETLGAQLWGTQEGKQQGHNPPEPGHAPPRCVCSRWLLGHLRMLKSVIRGELAISVIPRCHSERHKQGLGRAHELKQWEGRARLCFFLSSVPHTLQMRAAKTSVLQAGLSPSLLLLPLSAAQPCIQVYI